MIRDLLRAVQDLTRQSQDPSPLPPTQSSTPIVVNHTPMIEQFRRHKLPTFDGSSGPLVADEWLHKLERIFRLLTVLMCRKLNAQNLCSSVMPVTGGNLCPALGVMRSRML
ncbi:Uncharacterized protein Adt_14666 [Abeliophyllum distichum]|uniref:Uncharacterized protein n=1 Tax=Abeliophyllum distichum TaxID=126358 RepID=A0ABD1U0B5_9LAMI